jgi:hypothetical protein
VLGRLEVGDVLELHDYLWIIGQVLAILSWISAKYLSKVLMFVLLCLGSDFLPNDVYRVV